VLYVALYLQTPNGLAQEQVGCFETTDRASKSAFIRIVASAMPLLSSPGILSG